MKATAAEPPDRRLLAQMLCALMVGILAIISSTGSGVIPSAECAVEVDRSLEGQCRDQFREFRPADRIEDDARALAVSNPHHFRARSASSRDNDMHSTGLSN